MLVVGRRMPSTSVAHYAGVGGPPATGGRPAAAPRRSDRRRRVRRGPRRTPSAADDEVTRLVTQLYREADRIASRSPVSRRGTALGVTFPDPIFRGVVGKLSKP